MARIERWHERVADLPTAEEVRERAREGWRIAAVARLAGPGAGGGGRRALSLIAPGVAT
ncbi:MAG TPA: hypothetical protein VGG06_08410 [Thermoanaerobaculia bacterium]